jgi:hypothetical protein
LPRQWLRRVGLLRGRVFGEQDRDARLAVLVIRTAGRSAHHRLAFACAAIPAREAATVAGIATVTAYQTRPGSPHVNTLRPRSERPRRNKEAWWFCHASRRLRRGAHRELF